jgi:hypothetical protein
MGEGNKGQQAHTHADKLHTVMLVQCGAVLRGCCTSKRFLPPLCAVLFP